MCDLLNGANESNKELIIPHISKKNKYHFEWDNHEDFEEWQSNNFSFLDNYGAIIKGYHRAFVFNGEINFNCLLSFDKLWKNRNRIWSRSNHHKYSVKKKFFFCFFFFFKIYYFFQ